MKNIFVTGISGLLGSNLLIDLLESGFIVRGFIRDKSKFIGKNHPHLELIQGNLFDDLSPFLKDIDVVIHLAAETNQNLINYSDYWKINYKATVDLFDAAIRSKVKKFVFVSTANTIGYGSLNELGREKIEIKFPFNQSFYARSKQEAENYLLKNKDKLDLVLIHPSFMIGALDSKPSSGKIILMAWKKKIIFYPPGGKNFVHVKDVSKSILNCLEKEVKGKKYLIGNENLSYFDFFSKLNRIANQKPIMIKIPKIMLVSLGFLGNFISFFKIKTSLSSTNMKILCINNFYSNDKSKVELEMKYQPIDNAIKDAIDYFDTYKLQKNRLKDKFWKQKV